MRTFEHDRGSVKMLDRDAALSARDEALHAVTSPNALSINALAAARLRSISASRSLTDKPIGGASASPLSPDFSYRPLMRRRGPSSARSRGESPGAQP